MSSPPCGQKRKLIRNSILGVFFGIVAINIAMFLFGAGYTIHHNQKPPQGFDIAIVFGGGVIADRYYSAMAKNRMDEAISLYRSGAVKTLLLSGDDGAFRVNEVSGMGRYAIAQGVATSSIWIDPHGYRTFDSCVRARRVFGVRRALVVSQSFHLPRIIFLCRAVGIDVRGVPAPWHAPFRDRLKTSLREVFARVLALWDVSHFWIEGMTF